MSISRKPQLTKMQTEILKRFNKTKRQYAKNPRARGPEERRLISKDQEILERYLRAILRRPHFQHSSMPTTAPTAACRI